MNAAIFASTKKKLRKGKKVKNTDLNLNELKLKMDRIIVDEKEFRRISKYWKEHDCSTIYDGKLFFPLSDFILDVQCDKHTKLFGLMELVNYSPVNYTFTSKQIYMQAIRKSKGFEFDVKDTSMKNHTKSEIQKYAEVNHAFITGILIYIIRKAEERRRIYKEALPNVPDEKEQEKKEKVYKDRELFFLNDIIEFVTDHPTKKSIQYLKDVWGVRGHLRHYQNGVVVFIKPYKKGRKRDTMEPENRTYLIEKEGEQNEQRTD